MTSDEAAIYWVSIAVVQYRDGLYEDSLESLDRYKRRLATMTRAHSSCGASSWSGSGGSKKVVPSMSAGRSGARRSDRNDPFFRELLEDARHIYARP